MTTDRRKGPQLTAAKTKRAHACTLARNSGSVSGSGHLVSPIRKLGAAQCAADVRHVLRRSASCASHRPGATHGGACWCRCGQRYRPGAGCSGEGAGRAHSGTSAACSAVRSVPHTSERSTWRRPQAPSHAPRAPGRSRARSSRGLRARCLLYGRRWPRWRGRETAASAARKLLR